ncbi:MAG: glycosyltransferase [Pirellulales bacterium]
MLYLSLVILLLTVFMSAHMMLGLNSILWLKDWDIPLEQTDKISVIVPARNEQQHIEHALRSILKIDYPEIEFIVVNDRSTDSTGEILTKLSGEFPQLRVVSIEQLPSGWLGKNNALYQGAKIADGEWLLFADADIWFEPSTLRRAISYSQHFKLDHLAVTPAIDMPGALLKLFVVSFIAMFCAYFKPWQARNPKSSRYVGIGAFNLMRREAYWKSGSHEAIRMRPDDDMMLGKIIKKHGFRQDTAHGVGVLSVPWYSSMREAIVGLEKNAFSGVNYRISIVVAGAAVLLLTHIWPFVAVFVRNGFEQLAYAGTCLLLLGLAARITFWMRVSPLIALGFPLGVLMILYVQWRAMYLTLRQDGIRWRDTHYSLSELKANQV